MLPFTGIPSYVHDIIDDYGARLAMDAAGGHQGGGGVKLAYTHGKRPWQEVTHRVCLKI